MLTSQTLKGKPTDFKARKQEVEMLTGVVAGLSTQVQEAEQPFSSESSRMTELCSPAGLML